MNASRNHILGTLGVDVLYRGASIGQLLFGRRDKDSESDPRLLLERRGPAR